MGGSVAAFPSFVDVEFSSSVKASLNASDRPCFSERSIDSLDFPPSLSKDFADIVLVIIRNETLLQFQVPELHQSTFKSKHSCAKIVPSQRACWNLGAKWICEKIHNEASTSYLSITSAESCTSDEACLCGMACLRSGQCAACGSAFAVTEGRRGERWTDIGEDIPS